VSVRLLYLIAIGVLGWLVLLGRSRAILPGDTRGHSGFVFERIFVPWRLRAEFVLGDLQDGTHLLTAPTIAAT